MKRMILTGLLVAGLALAGCVDGGGAIDGRTRTYRRPQDNVPGVDVSQMKGPFTIYCRKFLGLDRHDQAMRHLRALERKGMPNGYSVDEPGGTVLYYGTYQKHDSPLAKKDLDTIRRFLYGQPRQKAFPVAALTPIQRPAKAYFPLAQARKDGLYSLMIAVFNGPQKEGRTFQESAVVLARTLREQEKLEAYVHHGETSSAVCLGAFVPEAIYIEQRAPQLSTDPRDLAGIQTSDDEAARRTKVVDPKAKALQQKFPHMMYNGGRKWRWAYRYVGKLWVRRQIYAPTVFVEIPGRTVNQRGEVIIERIIE